MPFIGLGKGFITFGTLNHKILQTALASKTVSQSSLQEDLESDSVTSAHIAVALRRLTQHGFLYQVGRDRKPGCRSHALFALEDRWAYFVRHKSTSAEKSRRYREKKKVKVPSVFEFRGEIKL